MPCCAAQSWRKWASSASKRWCTRRFSSSLRGDEPLLLGERLLLLGDLAAQRHGGLGRVAAIELHLGVERLALAPQFGHAGLGHGRHLVHLRDGRRALGIVRDLVRIARDQHALATPLLGGARAFVGLLAALGLQRGALLVGQGGPHARALRAGRPQHALFAVGALGDGAVRGEAAALGIHAGVDAAGPRLLLRLGRDTAQEGQRRSGARAPEAQLLHRKGFHAVQMSVLSRRPRKGPGGGSVRRKVGRGSDAVALAVGQHALVVGSHVGAAPVLQILQ